MAVENNWENDVTIMGTDASDELNNWDGSNVEIDAGAGDDSVMNWGSFNVIINAGADNDSVMNWQGTYLTIDAGIGSDTVRNSGTNVAIIGGEGDDSINNDKLYTIIDEENVTLCPDYTSINAGNGNDNISNEGVGVIIFTEAGDDFISNKGANASINAGNDNDTIFNAGNNVVINGDSGDDSISNGGSNVTINGGDGNDTLTGHSAIDLFVYSGGNDIITNYSGEDIVYISTGGINSYSFNGSDLIFHVNGGSLTLKSMKNHAITVQDAFGNVSLQIYGTGYSGADVMRTFVQSMANSSLDTDQKIDEAIKACSHFNSLQEVKNQIITDLQIAGDGETFLRDYCGIFLDNADTGAVTGWDAGGLTVKTKDDLLPKSGSASYPNSTTFTKRGLTITVPEKSTLTEQEQLVIQGLYSWWIEDAVKLIEEAYGLKFTDKPLLIPFAFSYEPDESYWALGGPSLTLNMSHTKFEASDKSGNGLDGVFSHEITHVMQYNFNSFDTGFLVEAVANITKGLDDQYSTVEAIRNVASSSENLTAGFNSNNADAGMIFLRYLMRQASDNYNSTSITTDNSASTTDNLITTTDNSTTTTDNSITTTDNSTTTTDNSTTTTDNQFVYTGGNQVISNYNGQPITLGAYTGATFDEAGNFFVGSPTGTLIITNAADKIVDLRDGAGNAFVKAYKSSTAGVIDGRGLAGYEIINGASAGSNVIFAGDGGSQLWGGSDDADALVGGNGADIFNGGRFQGADNILNASSADVVNFTDATLSDIVATAEVGGAICLGFNTGNVINIQSTELLSAAVKLADGSSWRFNHVTKSWQGA